MINEIRNHGADLVALSPQTPEHSRRMVEDNDLTFDVLSDRGNRVADAFGLVFEVPDYLRDVYRELGVNLPDFNEDDSWTLPISARYVLDSEGIIRSADLSVDYTVRPDPSKTLEVLDRLK